MEETRNELRRNWERNRKEPTKETGKKSLAEIQLTLRSQWERIYEIKWKVELEGKDLEQKTRNGM